MRRPMPSPLDLTTAFSAFPNGGYAVRPRSITRVIDADGGVAYENIASRERVISEPVAYQVVSMLEDVIARGTATAARASYGVRFPAAGKTGTTDDFKDAWFVGYTRQLVAGVWLGSDQGRTMGKDIRGGTVPATIWKRFMDKATSGQPVAALAHIELAKAAPVPDDVDNVLAGILQEKGTSSQRN